MKSSSTKRRIEEVLNIDTGESVSSSIFFKITDSEIHKIRRNQELAIQRFEVNDVLVCYFCKQIIKIKGKPEGKGKTIKYFSHVADTEDCHLKTNGKYTKDEVLRIKYNGAKESKLHIALKEFIASALEKAKNNGQKIEDIKVEKIFKDKAISLEWKKPDVQCKFFEKSLVFELQLSTTFLSVIVKREEFYKVNKTFILWVFSDFNLNEDLQKFTQKDIVYSNNRNAFTLTEDAKELTIKNKELTLLCHYQVPLISHKTIVYTWEQKYVTLDELTYDESNYRIYYYDSDSKFKDLEKKIQEQQIDKQENQKSEVKEVGIFKIPTNLEPILSLFNEFRVTDIEKYELTRQINYLSKQELEILGRTLENKFGIYLPFWFTLLQKHHSNFTNFILRNEKIPLDCNVGLNGDARIQYLFSIDLAPSQFVMLYLKLLLKGLKLTPTEENWIKEKVKKYRELNRKELDKIIIIKYMHQLQTPELVKKIHDIIDVVFSIVSLKLGRVVGSDFKNLISVANNFIEFKPEYIELLISTLKINDKENVLKRESFQNKLKDYIKNPIEQNQNYNDVINIIFPELNRYR